MTRCTSIAVCMPPSRVHINQIQKLFSTTSLGGAPPLREAIGHQKCSFFYIVQKGGGGVIPMFNFDGKYVTFKGSFCSINYGIERMFKSRNR